MADALRAPFPYFGGKRRVAEPVWAAFGPTINNYVEPFFGSGAVLLGRPGGAGKIETVNDRDRMLSNFWRALVADPWAVAEWADAPVLEPDMHAWHVWLVQQLAPGSDFVEKMHTDPFFYDPMIAGRWVHGQCAWIGSGWCVEPQNHKHPKLDGIGKGVHSQRGRRGSEATHRKRPEVVGPSGVHARRRAVKSRQSPQLRVHPRGGTGNGVHSSIPDQIARVAAGERLPSIGNDRGIHGVSARDEMLSRGTFLNALHELAVPDAPPCFAWFSALAQRLRNVRVVCGDWTRVVGNSVLGKGENVGGRRPCGVFLDPPYLHELREPGLYSEDDPKISIQVREWAIENGDDPDLRIALCGYWEEHDSHMPSNWRRMRWTGARGYAAEDNDNREKETIWFSPHCLGAGQQQELFGRTA